MKYFTSEFLDFFKELAANNNRDWFQANKKRYETHVKKAMEVFVGDLISELRKEDKKLLVKPSDVIFRINRDIRFSKDKSPYKLYTSAAISRDGKKAEGGPGIYVELGPEKLGMACGVYSPDKQRLESIRQAMARKPKVIMDALKDKTFKKMWGEMQGEKNKIIAPELKEAAEACPYIFNKQFYFWVELDSKIIIGDKLMKTVLEHHAASKTVTKFLDEAIK